MSRLSNQEPASALALSPEVAARLIGLGRTKFFELIREGKLRARKVGRRTLILRSDLEAFLASLPEGDK